MEAKDPFETEIAANPKKDVQGRRTKLLQLSEISLSLDGYDDLFSDFDPRPNPQRALSEDFLAEIKRASRDKPSGGIELKFLVPKEKRKPLQEQVIKKRLREHFRKHHDLLVKEVNAVIRQGITFILFGIIVMFIATILLFNNGKTALTSFFIILLEPAGWFFFWEGLNQIIFESKKKKPDLEFYEKMSEADIGFMSY